MLKKSAFALTTAVCLVFTTQAHAQTTPSGDAESKDDAGIVVIGSGETRSVSTLVPSNLDVLPPGTSVQKALNFLPGVMAQSIDPLGLNEQSMSLQVRGFSTTHLGYALDGIPLGDGAYNNYNGLTINRALISDNLGRADLATGIAGLGIPSTSNLGGAVTYTSSDPHKQMGGAITQSFGSDSALRTYVRLDTGEHNGFSAYLSGQYSRQNLFVNQAAGNTSTGKQFNGKAKYQFNGGVIRAFVDVSRTNQADDAYLSKDMLNRRGWDFGGMAPDWQGYLGRSYCVLKSTKCSGATAYDSEYTYTNGQILRSDELYYITGDFNLTKALTLSLKAYHHHDKGAGNNFINSAYSTQGTADTSDDVPVQIRDTRYTINRSGGLGSLTWDVAFNRFQAGFWLEQNTSSAARYIWSNVKGPSDLAQYLQGQPDSAQWVQSTDWKTRQFYLQDTMSLLQDRLTVDFGFKGTYSRSDAHALPGIAKTAPPASSQFANGSLVAKDYFLPQVGLRYKLAQGHEIYASYAENMAMYQGGFKLGPQSVTQTVWNAQGGTLKPEKSRSVEGGYRFVSRTLQLTLSGYYSKFDNRLLQYNPCATARQSEPGCGNSFHNAGSVTAKGMEIGALWKPLNWLSWYNSLSLNSTTYDQDLNWCSGASCVIKATAGKQQVDTPKTMVSSMVTVKQHGFSASLQGKYTGRRYYTYTNDQSFGGYFTLDAGLGYDFGVVGPLKGVKASLNITNLTNKRYAANFDNSVFAPDDASGTVQVFHASAPRQVFGSIGIAF
ncbi:TonB-dependent receptor domain-containing protein [Novosphingobium terrae]